MSNDEIPFVKLRALLHALGFSERVIDGKYLGYYHAASDTNFTFHLYKLQEPVSMMDLTGVRKQLDWRGLLGDDAFDAALLKVSA
jgi:hypothetical protein